MEKLLPILTRANLALATQYASVPDMIRGFGHVKEANIKKAEARYAELEAALKSPRSTLAAAE